MEPYSSDYAAVPPTEPVRHRTSPQESAEEPSISFKEPVAEKMADSLFTRLVDFITEHKMIIFALVIALVLYKYYEKFSCGTPSSGKKILTEPFMGGGEMPSVGVSE